MNFWSWVRDNDTGERTLYLCGVIAEEPWFDDDVTPAAFKAELLSGDGDITVWINSPGGDCLAASQIYNMLMEYRAGGARNVTVKIDSIAASAASVIAMAGSKVLISPTGLMFVHNPASIAIGDSAEMRKAIQMLDEVKESIINAYAAKTNLSRAKLSHLMDSETWMNAHMAIDMGFADDLLFHDKAAKDPAPNAAPVTVEDSYSFCCRTVSNSLLAKIKAKYPAPDSAPAPPAPDPASAPAPAVPEKTAQPVEDTPPAGVHISELERRLDLLKPYGIVTPFTKSI